jgi:hypothetical protein
MTNVNFNVNPLKFTYTKVKVYWTQVDHTGMHHYYGLSNALKFIYIIVFL